MAVITINEAMKQPTQVRTSDISKISEEVNNAKDVHDVCVAIARYVRDNPDEYTRELLVRVRYCKSLSAAQTMFYTFLLSVEGQGVLKEYETKYVRHKGSAIGGMECHSPRS